MLNHLARLFSSRQGKARSGPPEVHLAVFGKHPGWNDHIDDIGLCTQTLVEFKSLVYLRGIGGQIDSGAWDKLDVSQRTDGFDHWILSVTPCSCVLARVWSSVDGKGRGKYPMIAAVHTDGAGAEWTIDHASPALEALRRDCQQTHDADKVRAIVQSTRQELESKLPRRCCACLEVPAGAIGQLANRADLGPDSVGVIRVLYQLAREISGGRVVTLRVPWHEKAAGGRSLLDWLRLVAWRFGDDAQRTPALVIASEQSGLIDIVIGPASGKEFFALRASRAAVPCTTEVPYTMDHAFVQQLRDQFQTPTPPAGMTIAGHALALLFAVGVLAQAARESHAQPAPPTQPTVEPTALEPREQYNTALRELRDAVRTPGISDEGVAAHVREFTSRIKAIPGGVAYLASVDELLTRLAQALTSTDSADQQRVDDFESVGPASTGVYRAERVSPVLVRFEPIAAQSSAPVLEFAVFELPESPDRAAQSGRVRTLYLCTSELSVGQVMGILRARRLDQQFQELLTPVDPRDDAREGIRTWEWLGVGGPSPSLRPATSWHAPGVSGGLYAENVLPKPPTLDTPMQHLGVPDALFLAAAFACRLPTQREWAFAESACRHSPAQQNVRDSAFAAQQTRVREMSLRGRQLPAPDLASYNPGENQDGVPTPADDGELWFQPVIAAAQDAKVQRTDGSSRPLMWHMLGNVAELVIDDSAADLATLTLRPLASEARQAATLLGTRVYAVGGSAISRFSADPRTPLPLVPERASVGFADVGVRLAFSPPRPAEASQTVLSPLARRVSRLLDPLPTLERKK